MLDEETMQGDIQAEYLSILSTEMKITECLVRQILPRELAQQVCSSRPFSLSCNDLKVNESSSTLTQAGRVPGQGN